MTQPSISLAIIVKNEGRYIGRLLRGLKDHVDEMIVVDTGSTDNTKELAKAEGAKVYDFKWIEDFSAARNFSFSKATGDWIFWVDGDDYVEHPEKLRELVQSAPPNLDGYMFRYNYAFDESGNVDVVHWKFRLVRNDGTFKWQARIHEDLLPQRQSNNAFSEEVVINHYRGHDRAEESLKRNLRILMDEYQKTKDTKPDPRIVGELGRTLSGLKRYPEAVSFLYEHTQVSGWDEDRYHSWIGIAEIWLVLEKFEEAREAYWEAMKIRVDFPDAYMGLATVDYMKENWGGVVNWTKMGWSHPMPHTSTVISPTNYTIKPLTFLAVAQANLGNLDQAFEAISKAHKLAPHDSNVNHWYEVLSKVWKERNFVNKLTEAAAFLKEEKRELELRRITSVIPINLHLDPKVVRLKAAVFGRRKWKDNEIAIFCGHTDWPWGPWSLEDGIGGSEEAVINMARELGKMGWKVTVFNTVGERSPDYYRFKNGVRWLNTWEFNSEDEFNVLIAWRMPTFFRHDFTAKKKYLWLHDVPNPNDYTKEIVSNIDKIMCLSQYHRSLLPEIPDDKFFITNNGLNPADFEQSVKRNQYKCVYGSSQLRGLETLLQLWPQIRKQVPQATLDIYYGWETFDKMHHLGTPREETGWKKFKENIISTEEALADQGVTDHGRIGHQELAREYLEAGVWLYPTEFQEINCITAGKVQAAGCIPVTTNAAALEEAVQFGEKLDTKTIYTNKKMQKAFVEAAVRQLSKPSVDRKKMSQWSINRNSWGRTASGWDKELKS